VPCGRQASGHGELIIFSIVPCSRQASGHGNKLYKYVIFTPEVATFGSLWGQGKVTINNVPC